MLLINGGYGVGKSAVLDYVGDGLAARHEPFSLMDIDWFHRSWPVPVDDPGNETIEADNMAAVWANYRRCGPRLLVVAGVLLPASRDRYEQALDLPLRSVRLEAGTEVTVGRLRARCGRDREPALRWHLERFADLAEQLRRADLDETTIPTAGGSPPDIAEQILSHFGF